MPQVDHLKRTKERAIDLYFKIERHFALGGHGLRIKEIQDMLGLKSQSTTFIYVKLLDKWGLIKHNSFSVGTIVLAKRPEYPPIAYIDEKRRIVMELKR